MKKIIAIIAIILCFSVFAVSCANKQDDTKETTAAGTNGDGVVDWSDVVNQTTATPTQEGETTVATTVPHPQSWVPGVDNSDGYGPLKTGYN